MRCCYTHAKGETCHEKLGRQLTGHIYYFTYPSVTGTKRKKSSPKVFFIVFITPFAVRFELLSRPQKHFIFRESNSGFPYIVIYAKKVPLRLQMKNSITRKCFNSYCICNLNPSAYAKDSDFDYVLLSKRPQITSLQDPMDEEAAIQHHFHAQNVIYSISHNAHTYLLRCLP